MLLPIALLVSLSSLPGPCAGPADAKLPILAPAASAAPLMPWQRSLEDALALSKQTGKPLLICVNADGEVASERLAANQYRDPDFVKLVSGFIPVLASPTRHRKRDFDDFGGRLEDPKFGRIVESEHLEIEPTLYKRYFKGRRVAPRHVGVSPDGEILFDLFLLNNLNVIDNTLREQGVFDGPERKPAEGIGQLLGSHDHSDRQRLEALFCESNLRDRRALVGEAFSDSRSAQHPQLVRLALHAESRELQLAAVYSVLEHPAQGVQFMGDAYRLAEGQPELQGQIAKALAGVSLDGMAAARRLEFKRLLDVVRGLSSELSCVDVKRWKLALDLGPERLGPAMLQGSEELTQALVRIGDELRDNPKDAGLHVLHGRALLALGETWIRDGGGNANFVLVDAIQAAEAALALDSDLPMAQAVLARAAYLNSDLPRAKAAASLALKGLSAWASEPLAAEVLALFATLRSREVYSAFNNQASMPAEAIADVCAAHEVLLMHPDGTAQEAIEYLNFLNTIGGSAREERVVRQALQRFSSNGTLHGYLRHYVLRDRGAAGMETAYLDFQWAPGDALDGAWYSALSVLVAAERHAQEGRLPQALTAYRNSIKGFQRVLERNPDYAVSSNHYIGMAHAGIARQLTDTGDLDGAMAELRAAAAASITCFGAKDGLDRIPKKTVAELSSLLRGRSRSADAEKLAADLTGFGIHL